MVDTAGAHLDKESLLRQKVGPTVAPYTDLLKIVPPGRQGRPCPLNP